LMRKKWWAGELPPPSRSLPTPAPPRRSVCAPGAMIFPTGLSHLSYCFFWFGRRVLRKHRCCNYSIRAQIPFSPLGYEESELSSEMSTIPPGKGGGYAAVARRRGEFRGSHCFCESLCSRRPVSTARLAPASRQSLLPLTPIPLPTIVAKARTSVVLLALSSDCLRSAHRRA
jgi:hypothetical protein